MHRLFVALRPPEPLRDLLIDAMEDGPTGVRWQSDEQLHVTLRFVGERDSRVVEDIASALGAARSPRLAIALSGVGRFDQSRRGALWAGVAPREPLKSLHDKVDRACVLAGLQPEGRAYLPHVTVARWSNGKIDPRDWLLRHAKLSSAPFEIDHFGLFESTLSRHGAHYEEIARFPLR